MRCSTVKLDEAEVEAALRGLPGWTLADGKLQRDYVFADFLKAMEFVNHVAHIAEEADHHPDIDIRYNLVRLGLTTHAAGAITVNDTEMAARLNWKMTL